ncbi:hypothetical protein ACFQ77_27205 [Streptomyces virginiae]|uniref:hypothetical protein n=1 Tax=Streptomyces virginiae TaxID=1961 RepID=UPI0036CBBAC3
MSQATTAASPAPMFADRFASFGPGWEEYRADALSAAAEAELKLRGPQPPTR